MAAISDVSLSITDSGPGTALVEVEFTVSATHHDAEHEQSYREVVQLMGVDSPPVIGEDGIDDPLAGGLISDGIVTFSPSEQAFTYTRARNVPDQVLDEDPGPFIRSDEIRARVTLTPLPPAEVQGESNVVERGALEIGVVDS